MSTTTARPVVVEIALPCCPALGVSVEMIGDRLPDVEVACAGCERTYRIQGGAPIILGT